jgi:peroxiredoxin Q/BCP
VLGAILCAFAAEDKVDLKVGDKAPAFKLAGSDDKEYTLEQFAGKSWVVLNWYPRAGSTGATTTSDSIQAQMEKISQYKVQVFGISTSAIGQTKNWANLKKYTFPQLADPAKEAAKAYGALRTEGAGAGTLTQRWLMVIDDQGVIKALEKSEADQQKRGEALLKLLEDLKAPKK